ncbi:MAG: [protein-PII] uridylyltransferase [Actinomycetes bacterium]
MAGASTACPHAETLAHEDGAASPGAYRERRAALLAEMTDEWLTALVHDGVPGEGVALAAVGGQGRRDPSPRGDLDLVLLHAPEVDVRPVAEAVWYPVWDSGVRLDHAVRTVEETREVAGRDVPALLGLLDLRHVAGDAELTAQARSTVLRDYRAASFRRLPEVLVHARQRAGRAGELPFLVEPDLKEARGGLRDFAVLRAVGASWLADVPWFRLDAPRRALLDVRDALHLVTGREVNRLLHQEQDEVADLLGYADADELLRAVSTAGRAVQHVVDVVERQARRAVSARDRHRGGHAGRPGSWRPLTRGALERDGEVALDPRADPSGDPLLAIRAAAVAARYDLPLAPGLVDRLATHGADLPVPWPAPARDAFVSLLGAGPGLVPVWEALDQSGVVARLLPEWDAIRSLPQRNPVHRHTVDRHSVEAVVHAAALTTRVDRPDLLLLAALCHDLGKGERGADHATAGEDPARSVARRVGLDDADADLLVLLVRHHLLLVTTATRRDPGDPATVSAVRCVVGSPPVLDLLHVLTEADARAAGPAAWTTWRAACVGDLVGRVHAAFRGVQPPARPALPEPEPGLWALAADGAARVRVRSGPHGLGVTVVSRDRRGLLAAVAGVLSLRGLSVRTAVTRTQGGGAVMQWDVTSEEDPRALTRLAATLQADLARAVSGDLDVDARLDARRTAGLAALGPPGTRPTAPQVRAVPDASEVASVLEVRSVDAVGLLHRVARLIADEGVDVTAARVATFGSRAVDVFFVVGADGRPLPNGQAGALAARLESSLA